MTHSRPKRDGEIKGKSNHSLINTCKCERIVPIPQCSLNLVKQIYLVMETVSTVNVNESFCFLLAAWKFCSPSIGLTLPPGSTCLPVVFICLEGLVKILNSGY